MDDSNIHCIYNPQVVETRGGRINRQPPTVTMMSLKLSEGGPERATHDQPQGKADMAAFQLPSKCARRDKCTSTVLLSMANLLTTKIAEALSRHTKMKQPRAELVRNQRRSAQHKCGELVEDVVSTLSCNIRNTLHRSIARTDETHPHFTDFTPTVQNERQFA